MINLEALLLVKYNEVVKIIRRSIMKHQQRKEDTRRKILLGSYLLKKMEDEAEKQKILAEINEYLTEDRDRKLFGL